MKVLAITILILFLYSILTETISIAIHKEGFIPKMVKETYQPIKRNIRINYEGFYNNTSVRIHNFFRKFGIL